MWRIQPTQLVTKVMVEEWLTEKVPVMYRSLQREDRLRECRFHFEYWTCGSFDADAIAFLTSAAGKTKKYEIGWKDGNAVRDYARKVRPSRILEMFDQHFFKHPIARFVRKEEAKAKAPQNSGLPAWMNDGDALVSDESAEPPTRPPRTATRGRTP